MFTVEHEDDHTIVTILDVTNEHEDVHVIIEDDGVWIRQWDESLGHFELISLTHDQWQALIMSLDCEAGAYIVVDKTYGTNSNP